MPFFNRNLECQYFDRKLILLEGGIVNILDDIVPNIKCRQNQEKIGKDTNPAAEAQANLLYKSLYI